MAARKKPVTAPPKKAAPRKKTAKPAKQSERSLHMHCQQWLEKSGWWDKLLIFHVPNERRGGIGAMMHFKRLGVRPGVADYLVFVGFRACAIELKDKDGEMSIAQKEFKHLWEDTGKPYLVVRTLDEFQATVFAMAIFA